MGSSTWVESRSLDPWFIRAHASPRRGWPYLRDESRFDAAELFSSGLLPRPSTKAVAAPSLRADQKRWLKSLVLPDLPMHIDARVMEYLEFYRDSERGRAIAREWAAKSGRYVPVLMDYLESQGLPRDLVWLSMVESGHDPSIRSRAGALGLWQFMPSTARLYGLEVNRWVDERHDPELSTLAAVHFLKELRDQFGSWELAMAAYNMGPGGLERAVRKYNTNDYWTLSRFEAGIPWETTRYVPKIVATALLMNNQAAFGLTDVVRSAPEQYDTIQVPSGRLLAEVARAAQVPVSELVQLNPQLLKQRTPPATAEGPTLWRVHVPAGRGEMASASLAGPRADDDTDSSVAYFGATLAGVFGDTSPSSASSTESKLASTDSSSAQTTTEAKLVAVVPPRTFSYPGRRQVFYSVWPGDTPNRVADAFGVTLPELMLWNSLDPVARLQQGQVLRLFVEPGRSLAGVVHATPDEVQVLEAGSPAFFEYFERRHGRVRLVVTAKAGDTLNRIGRRYGIRGNAMERINQRSRWERLAQGEQVVVYVKTWRAAQHASSR